MSENNNQKQPVSLAELSPEMHYLLACVDIRIKDQYAASEKFVQASDAVIRALINENQALKQQIKKLQEQVGPVQGCSVCPAP